MRMDAQNLYLDSLNIYIHSIIIPVSGFRGGYDGNIYNICSSSWYCTSGIYSITNMRMDAQNLYLDSLNIYSLNYNDRISGFTVRLPGH